ncbi:MAG: hypothetical protein ABR574_05950 [Cryomorphaceae bacterium]|nr:hypothetical protein [Flavobacteriales bacterium]
MKISKFVSIVFLAFMGCSSGGEQDQDRGEKGLKELNRAIEAIEDRRDAELRIVEEQAEMRDVLRENVSKAKSDGMREKIERDLRMKEISIERAERNLANQDSLLFQLRLKRDSLNAAGDS